MIEMLNPLLEVFQNATVILSGVYYPTSPLDHLDAHERKQNSSPLELPLDVEEGVFNDEVQQNEATQLTDQEIALDASSDGSLSSGEQRRDYMMSSGAEDDQTGEGGSMSHGYTYY
ncbi:hypothetical protein Tco_1561669 [Tanacetum coccineum]